MTADGRAVWGTRKYRAEDLIAGDVVRNSFGKWARIKKVATSDLYTSISFDVAGATLVVRDVHLVDVQIAKPS